MNHFIKNLYFYISDKSSNLKLVECIWLFLFFVSCGLIFGASTYAFLDAEIIARRQVTTGETYPWVFIHVLFSMIWVISGFLQFTKTFQVRRKLHKINGLIYIGASLIGLIALLTINLILQERAPFTPRSIPPTLYSIICILVGYICIRGKNVEEHRGWMIRSMVGALLMPISRLFEAVTFYFGFRVHDFWILLGCLIFAELMIYRKLDFKIFRKEFKMFNFPVAAVLVFMCVCGFSLTFIIERHIVNMTGPFLLKR